MLKRLKQGMPWILSSINCNPTPFFTPKESKIK